MFDDTMFMHACGDRQNDDLTRILHSPHSIPWSYLRRGRSEVRQCPPHVRPSYIISEAYLLVVVVSPAILRPRICLQYLRETFQALAPLSCPSIRARRSYLSVPIRQSLGAQT